MGALFSTRPNSIEETIIWSNSIEEIDLQVLLHMSESELDSIGLGPQRKLMLVISGA